MATVDLTKATASNWQSLAKAVIKYSKSVCGNANIWNGPGEFNAISNYYNQANTLACKINDIEQPEKYQALCKLTQTLQNAMWSASEAINKCCIHSSGEKHEGCEAY